MRALGSVTLLVAVALLLTASVAAQSQSVTPYTPAELDELFAPIALYPDPLLAQILPAATFPDQLLAASQFTGYQPGAAIDSQPWDVSVKAVAHYPSVLKMMVDSPDWTIAIGQAYVNQADDVMKSIQRLRAKARLMGYLNSNSQQTVSVSGGYISIVPAQAQYVYVPTYNPQVVYVQRAPNYGAYAIAFGAGLLIGAWLNNNINWNQHRVYYHGWHGGGWVARSRPRVQINNRHYVNPGYANRPVRINPAVRTRDITTYRRDVQRNAGTFVTPGLVRPTRPTPAVRPGVPTTRPVAPTVRPNVPTTRPAVPGTRPKPGVPTTRPRVPTTTPGAGVTPAIPGTGPRVPEARPTPRPIPLPGPPLPRPSPRPRPGVTKPQPAPTTAPGVIRHGGTPRPSAGVSRPSGRPATPGGVTRQAPPPKPSTPKPRPGEKTGGQEEPAKEQPK